MEEVPAFNFRLLAGAATYEGFPQWRGPLNLYGTK